MDTKIIAIIAVVAVVAAGAGVYFVLSGDSGDQNDDRIELDQPITVKDALGKSVNVKYKIDRVALTDGASIEFFASSWGDGWEDHVCMMPEDLSSRDAYLGDYIEKTWPKLSKLPKCPDLYVSLASNPNAVAEKIMETNPDLVILPGSTMSWLQGIDGFYKIFADSDIPVFNTMFYTIGLTETVADVNYGAMGKILQKEDRCNRIVKFHNDSLAALKDKLKSHDKSVKIYYEVPGADASQYGNVVNMGVPEVNLIGTNVLTGVPMDSQYNIEKMNRADPDWIFIVDTSYYSGKQSFGMFAPEDKAAAAATLAKYTSRDGWSDLDAVKDKHVALIYGELRHGVTSLFSAYQMANIINKSVVSDEELSQFEKDISTVLPWEFKGYFGYVME
ncbi:MAG: hypothetical protein E7Z64_06750 [Thermoplasmata archaeon]|nr:hypothetical protein [Thermoplasmata archaeon]